MSQLPTRPLALACAVVLVPAAVATITITPSSHDFGEVAVNAMAGLYGAEFRIALPPGAPMGDTVTLTLAGANPTDFLIGSNETIPIYDPNIGCANSPQGSLCSTTVEFRPKSVGHKTATLVVADSRGNRGTAQLKGEGVAALCEMKVVWCNYAHLYSGTFIWTSGVNGPASQYREHVQVDVVRGVASCNGAVQDTDQGRTRTGAITGAGLIAIEFEKDAGNRPIYRVTVACPTPDWPATADEPATPSRPAELGHNEQKSYDQPAPPLGGNLVGSDSIPAPETDPANGVTGFLRVSWEFCAPARYRIVPTKVCV